MIMELYMALPKIPFYRVHWSGEPCFLKFRKAHTTSLGLLADFLMPKVPPLHSDTLIPECSACQKLTVSLYI